MPDTDHDEEFDKAFEGFGEDKAPVTPPAADPPAAPVAAEPPKADPPKPAEEPKKDEQTPVEPKKEEVTPPANDEKKPEASTEPPKTPETPSVPPVPEGPKPLTEDSIRNIISEIRTEERTSGQALEETTKEVLDAYYPDGLSNVLTDTNGKELKTPQDVVDASNGQMQIEEAAQWLINEQFKLDQDINKIRNDAKTVAETTLKFKRDGLEVLQRYEPLFKAYPFLQNKVWNAYRPLVKADEQKNVILSAPDMREFYDTMLEPYRLAFEYQSGQPGTTSNTPVTPSSATPPPVAAPSTEDRLDESGDGGTTPQDDPNDFAQQVSKELAKGI